MSSFLKHPDPEASVPLRKKNECLWSCFYTVSPWRLVMCVCVESYFLPLSLFPSVQLLNRITLLSSVYSICTSAGQEQQQTHSSSSFSRGFLNRYKNSLHLLVSWILNMKAALSKSFKIEEAVVKNVPFSRKDRNCNALLFTLMTVCILWRGVYRPLKQIKQE